MGKGPEKFGMMSKSGCCPECPEGSVCQDCPHLPAPPLCLLTVPLLLSTLPKLQVLCQPPTLHYVVAWWPNAADESWILWETEESPA